MLKKKYFDRSTLAQGPIKMYTREQIERLQVRPRDTKLRDPPRATIPNPPARVISPRPAVEVVSNVLLGEDLLFPLAGGNSVQDVVTAAGANGEELSALANPRKPRRILP
jgi:hypothetical protein